MEDWVKPTHYLSLKRTIQKRKRRIYRLVFQEINIGFTTTILVTHLILRFLLFSASKLGKSLPGNSWSRIFAVFLCRKWPLFYLHLWQGFVLCCLGKWITSTCSHFGYILNLILIIISTIFFLYKATKDYESILIKHF